MNPKVPYYAVIFTSQRTEIADGYSEMAERMMALARQQPGFLGVESARETLGITVSYWETLEAISNWKMQTDHLVAQRKGIADWYSSYTVRVCLVEREYGKAE
ncbi:MAG: antibiotic biosynthesis monooxygenase [Sediminicola sp.]|tara:strand:+ start:9511 stop:9819 length:309 start_codon:yes stop_codon:yes gene_type:complete